MSEEKIDLDLNEPLKFETVGRQLEVLLDDEKCTLREFYGSDRDEYLGQMSNNVRFVNGQPSGLKSYKNSQAKLLHLTLHHEEGDRFSIEEIQKLPASVVNGLYKYAEKLCGLDANAGDDAKND